MMIPQRLRAACGSPRWRRRVFRFANLSALPPCTHPRVARRRCCCAPRLAETPFKAEMIRRRVTMKTQTTASGGVGLGRGGRMSRQRKRDAVLRLLRGEDLEILSRALGVTAATLSGWQGTFVSAGEASLVMRPTNGCAAPPA